MASAAPQQPIDSLSNKLQNWLATCLVSPEPSTVKDALHLDARSFFHHLIEHTTVVTQDGVVLTTKKPAHEETIAKFIQQLEPAFCSRHAARANALQLLCGAIEGIQPAKLSHNTTKLIGAFLLGHCSPIEMENIDSGVGHDETVRDAAIVCLAALIKSRLDESDEATIVESVGTRLDLAMQGVERRCAVAETEMNEYDRSRRSGISMLPRSRRSICFDLIRSAVGGVQVVVDQYSLTDSARAATRDKIAKLVSYTATCMHGESDPRCLVQLLELLRAMQVTFAPFFLPIAASAFPARDVFEAVAPYYPVQFTPPPNDIHGITRQSLHAALMEILCEVRLGQASGPDSMLNLTAGIFIERLCPPEDDGTTNSTSVDILEAAQDLDRLLFRGTDSYCDQLDESTLQTLATALFSAHTKASFGDFESDGNATKTKTAADECRNLVSKVALHLESGNCEKLWTIFVLDIIRTHSSLLASSPQSNQGRASIAYIAALAACGGQRTLRSCLDVCLPFLIDILRQEEHDEEKLAAAVYGVAAFFSSTRVAVHRASSQDIAFHPHPLRAYSSAAFQCLCTILDIQQATSLEGLSPKLLNLGIQIAAIRAMEALLMASPQDQLEDGDLRRIEHFLDFIADVVVSSSREHVNKEIGREHACCRTLGTLLGRSLHHCEGESGQAKRASSLIEENNKVQEHLQAKIFLQLLTSVSREPANTGASRFDRMVLASACKDSPSASSKVVGRLAVLFYESLNTNRTSAEVHSYVRTLSFVFRFGGVFASESFHRLSPPAVTSEDILDLLGCSDDDNAGATRKGSFQATLDAGMSMLKLPATTEQLEDVAAACQQSYQLASQLRPAYEGGVTAVHLIKLVDRVSQVVPPLEDVDNVKLCVSLPLLASALMSTRRRRCGAKLQSSDGLASKLESVASPLAAYALSLEHNATARSAAVTSLCEIIRTCPSNTSEPLPARLINDIVVPAVQEALNRISVSLNLYGPNSKVQLRDSLFLLAALGSVAACAGLKSRAADEVVRFLVETTCLGCSRIPFENEVVDITIGGKFSEGQVICSSAFGTMLLVDDAGPSFWKQRLVHVALKHIEFPIASEALEVDHHASSGYPRPSLSILNMISHIVASSRIRALGKVAVKSITRQIVGGLIVVGGERTEVEGFDVVLPLVLAATIKLLCEATDTMSQCVSLVVLAHARLFTTIVKQDLTGMQSAILVLQGLATIAQNFRGNKSLELCKAAVLSVLGKSLNHPSRLIRQAALRVSNEWSVVG